MAWYANLLIVLAVFVAPCVLGYYLSRLWRMPDYFGKISLVLFTTLAGIVICVFGWPPKLGIDLRGGVILVYEVAETDKVKHAGKAAGQSSGADTTQQQALQMDKLIGAVGRRINPGGVREIVIRPYGANQIEIIVPEADEAEARRMKSLISRIGTLEFRILATTFRPQYRSYIERARTMPENQIELRDDDGNLLAWWVPVARGKEKSFDHPDIAIRKVSRRNPQTGKLEDTLEVLVVKDQFDVNGGYLTQATVSESMGRPSVHFRFNSAGALRFSRLTGSHLPDAEQNVKYYLGIILDGYLHSAPFIKSAISDSGEITGDFTNEEVQELVDVLNAGSLPTALSPQPISEIFTGPTLGSDTIRMGTNSTILSTIFAAGFMLIYYRFSGIVACLALAVNMVLLLACMILIKAAFSLPGLAGFALTIGMAVDSNVLIYERMREELDRGATIRMAIRNGFDRAFSAILDSHVTTLISAAVLYAIGQEQIKGFAITLFLGVAINLYTAVFCVHVVFDVAERQKWISKLKMMRFFTKVNFDFWAVRYKAYGLSIALIVVGLLAVFARGPGLLNIDFTGGVSVQIVFNRPQDIAYVRAKLDAVPELHEHDLVVSDVKLSDEEVGRRFVINTSSPPDVDAAEYLKKVQGLIRDTFAGELVTNTVKVSGIQAIATTAKPDAPSAKPAAPPAAKDQPPAKTQGRSDRPPSTWLAAADPASVLLALADPAGKETTEKSGEKPAPKTPEPSPAKPVEKPAEKPAEKVEKSADKSAPKPAEDKKERPADQPSGKAAEKPAPRPPAASGRFTGGTEATLEFAEAMRREAVEQVIRAELETRGESAIKVDFEIVAEDSLEGDASPQRIWKLRINLPLEEAQKLLATLEERLCNSPHFPSSNTIGGSVAQGTRIAAVYAILVSNLLIMLYLWIRFQRLSFGIAAIVALIHDVLVTLGFLALSAYLAPLFNTIGLRFLLLEPFKIGMTEVAAFLTIVGYSVSDTVVVFDRIREVRGKAPNLTPTMINLSINQTLSRTLLTSLTAWGSCVVLYFFGGPTIHGFAFAIIIGIITGTYSSIFVAAPLLLVGQKHESATPSDNGK
jgi:SecD/SecF fusion protein